MGNKSSKSVDTHGWIELKKLPLISLGAHVVVRDNNTFIIIPFQSRTKNRLQDPLYIYKISKNKWIKLIKPPIPWKYNSMLATAMNESKNMLYIIDSYLGDSGVQTITQLNINDIKTVKWNRIEVPKKNKTRANRALYINDEHCDDEIHLFWSDKHFYWNKSSNQFYNVLTSFDDDRNRGGAPIYIQSRQEILLFGGRRKIYISKNPVTTTLEYSRAIHSYSLKKKVWTELSNLLPSPLQVYQHGIVSCRNEKFVLIFGGRNKTIHNNKIYILNIATGQWVTSKLRIPWKGSVAVMIINPKNCLLNGYLGNIYTPNMPNGIVDIISSMIGFIEFVHLIHYNSGKHVRVNIDDILQT
eukprot:543490_1